MTRNSKNPTYTIDSFPGLSTTDDPFEVSYKGLVKALNVDITRRNKVRRRKGATLAVAQAGIRAAWADADSVLITEGTNLHSVNSAFALTLLRSDLTPTDILAAIKHNGKIYYSNGVETGVIIDGVDTEMGVQEPAKPVLVANTAGNMRAGLYQVALTYVRNDGLESGSGVPATITLASDNSGISVTYAASANPAVVAINVYMTRADGSEYYFAMQVANANDTTVYNAHASFLQRALRTEFKERPPAFDVIAKTHNNRMIYGKGHILTLSDPYAAEHINSGESYLPFSDRVTLVGVVSKGFFVGTQSNIYYVTGDTLENMTSETAAPYGAVFGTLTYVDSAILGEEGGKEADVIPAWMSNKGICVGLSSGKVVNLTERDVSIPQGLKGTSMFREEDGQKHIVSVIQK